MKRVKSIIIVAAAFYFMLSGNVHALTDNEVKSQHIEEADGVSGQNPNSGSGIKTQHIQNNAITTLKIKPGAVNARTIADGAITAKKMGEPCATGQILKKTDTGWACSADESSTGDITAVTAGKGLKGGGLSGDVTLNVDFGGTGSADTVARSNHNHDAAYVNEGQANSISTIMLQDNAVTGAKIKDGEISLSDLNPAVCANGQIIKMGAAGWECGEDANSGGTVKGSGTKNYVPRFTAAKAIGNSTIFDNGTNVGIGTTSPVGRLHIAGDEVRIGSGGIANHATGDGDIYVQNRLEVAGNIHLRGIFQNNDDSEKEYEIELIRYTMRIDASKYDGSTKRIPQWVISDFCGDEDGCKVTIGLTNWAAGANRRASFGPSTFFYNTASKQWRISNDILKEGADANGSTEHAMDFYNTCYFTDGEFAHYVNMGDNSDGMHLLLWNGLNYAERSCWITFED